MIAWLARLRACLADPPAESPSTMKISEPSAAVSVQSESLPGRRDLRPGAIQSDAAMLSIRESREAWHMAAAKLSDEAFSAILEAHPGLRERFASIAMAVANSGENLKEADAIEERIVEEMRLLGREAMQGWAETQVKATEKEIRQQPSMHRQGKKNSAGIRNLAKSRF
jgi:hypothetical protein